MWPKYAFVVWLHCSVRGTYRGQGIRYLHSHCNLIHRDLKTLNLLVNTIDNDVVVKVCDFGVSRTVDKKRAMTGNIG